MEPRLNLPHVAMIMFLRQLLAIALLPFTVTVLVPIWIAQRYGTAVKVGSSAGPVLLQLVGVTLIALGLVLFVASLRRFTTEGKGTLAPWDPPRIFNRTLDQTKADSPQAAFIYAAPKDGLEWVAGVELSEGTIEIEIKGEMSRGAAV